MWIRNQTGLTIINTANVGYIFVNGGTIKAVGIDRDSPMNILGSYSEPKTARAALEQILNAESKCMGIYEMPSSDYTIAEDTNMHNELRAGIVDAVKRLKYFFPEDNIDIHIEADTEEVDVSKIIVDDGNASKAVK